jgi:hypothetical protein
MASPLAADSAAGLRVGTTGIGLEVGTTLSHRVEGRIIVSGFDYGRDFSSDRLTYDGTAELRFATALVDWHPGQTSFRISLGVVWNGTEIVGTAPIRSLIAQEAPQFLDLPLPNDLGAIVATASGDEIAPYLGLGWGRVSNRSGWGFSFDVGALWFGEPEVAVELQTSLPIDAVPGARALVDSLLEQERQELQRDLEDYEIYPVVSFGISYRF